MSAWLFFEHMVIEKFRGWLFLALLFIYVSSSTRERIPLTSNINNLGVKTLQILHKQKIKENILINPSGIFSVIGMLFHGLNDEDRKAFKHALNIQLSNEEFKNEYLIYTSQYNVLSESINNLTANSMWYQHGLNIKDKYKQALLDMQCSFDSLNFLNQGTSEKTINLWVDKNTNHKIPEFFKKDLSQSTQVVLVCANYFSGIWNQEFSPSRTIRNTFYGEEQTTVEYMRTDGLFPYYANNYFECIRLPYKDKRYSFNIYLPLFNSSLLELSERITNEILEEAILNSTQENFSTVEIPKFALDFRTNLMDILSDLGLSNVLTKAGSFTEMTESGDLQLDKILHTTFIEINEKGTEAAGVTGAVLRKSANSFKANRPFMFSIVDEKLKVILFLGLFQRPN